MNSPSDDSQVSDGGGAVEAALRARLRGTQRQKVTRFVHSVPSRISAPAVKETAQGGSRHSTDKARKESSPENGTDGSDSSDASLSDDDDSDEDDSADASDSAGEKSTAAAPSPAVMPGQTSRNRYFGADLARARLSQKCFNCGQTGHMRTECEFGLIPRPCGLCGGTAHIGRICPVRRTLLERCDEERSMARRRSGYQRTPGVFAAVSVKGTHVICALCASPHHRTAVCPEADQLALTTSLETGLKGMPRAESLSLETSAAVHLSAIDAAKQQWTVAETIAFTRKAAALPRHASAELVGSSGTSTSHRRASAWSSASADTPQHHTPIATVPPMPQAVAKRRRSSSAVSLDEESVVSLDGDDDDDGAAAPAAAPTHESTKSRQLEIQAHGNGDKHEISRARRDSVPLSRRSVLETHDSSKRSRSHTKGAAVSNISRRAETLDDTVIVLDASPSVARPSNHRHSRSSSSLMLSSGRPELPSPSTATLEAAAIRGLTSTSSASVTASRIVTISDRQPPARAAVPATRAESAASVGSTLTAASLKRLSKKQRKERIKEELERQYVKAKNAGLPDDAARAWNNGFWATNISNISMMAGGSKAAKEVAIHAAKLRRSRAQEAALAAGFANPIPLN